MATYKQIQNPYLTKAILRYWANLVLNYNGFVFDEDFFAPVVRGTGEAMELLEAAYSPKAFEALMKQDGNRRTCIDPDDNLPGFLQNVWNRGHGKSPVKRMLWTMAARIEDQLAPQTGPDPIKLRFDEIQKAFSLSDLEREILQCAYLLDIDRLAGPEHFARNNDLTVFYAMAVNRSHDEVMAALANGSRLRKYELLDEDWEFNGNDFGSFMRSSDTAPLGRKYYRRIEGEALPWDFYGKLAEKDGALLKRMFQATGGKGRLNILLHGAPGAGKSSFARTLVRDLGLPAYEMPMTDEKGLPYSRSGRLTGLLVCNNILESGVLVIDEADALLQDSSPFGMDFLMKPSNQKTAKSLINGLLDESRIPTIWICNTPTKCIDPSVRRRFDFSIAFSELTLEQRRLVWENCVRAQGAEAYVPKALSDRLARDYRTNAASISIVLRNVKRLAPPAEEAGPLIERLLRNQCELTGTPVKRADQLPDRDYSLEGLRIRGKISLDKVGRAVETFAADEVRGADSPRMSILLWGPPGTGKTEYVKHLGMKTGLKVRHCSAGDFLDKFVGETTNDDRLGALEEEVRAKAATEAGQALSIGF